MKINLNSIPPEGLELEEYLSPAALELEAEGIQFSGPVKVEAEISRITNAVTVKLSLKASLQAVCSRCLNKLAIALNKRLNLNYPVGKTDLYLDLSPDIRQEIILDYPLKPLCSAQCKGLCPKCGRNLNEGKCNC